MRYILLLILFVYSLMNSAQSLELTKLTYVHATSFRHSNLEKLKFKRDNSFILSQKNFKGTQFRNGSWQINGDTLIMIFFEINKDETTKPETLLIKKDGLYDLKSNYCRFQTKKAWRAGGRRYEGGLSF